MLFDRIIKDIGLFLLENELHTTTKEAWTTEPRSSMEIALKKMLKIQPLQYHPLHNQLWHISHCSIRFFLNSEVDWVIFYKIRVIQLILID